MSTYYVAGIPYTDELYHHGIKGQKWGVRRWQNSDGTLNEAGKKRYYGSRKVVHKWYDSPKNLTSKQQKRFSKVAEKEFAKAFKQTSKESEYPDNIEAAKRTMAYEVIGRNEQLRKNKYKLWDAARIDMDYWQSDYIQKKYRELAEQDPDPNGKQNSLQRGHSLYMKDRGVPDGSRKRLEYERNKEKALKEYRDSVQAAVKSQLGKNGNTSITAIDSMGHKHNKTVTESLISALEYDVGYYWNELNELSLTIEYLKG